MKSLNKIIEVLEAIETLMTRRQATKRASRVAYRIALNGCRV